MLGSVSESVGSVAEMIHSVVSATEEQSVTVREITDALEQVSRLSQDTRVSAEGSHEASLGLRDVAIKLERSVDGFDLAFFGAVPAGDAIKMNQSFRPLADFVSKVLGQPIQLRLGHDYDDAIRDIGEGQALVSYQTPTTYLEARERYGVEPIVVPLAGGQPFYQCSIVVREDSGITSLAELAGRAFAFGDPKSCGTKAMPEAMLREAGVRIDDLATHGFVGSHDSVAHAVVNKNYDAGGLMHSIAEGYVKDGLRILSTSANIPQFPVCVSPKLPAELREKLQRALIETRDPKILGALGKKVTGFAKISDSDYDPIRTMKRALGI